MSSSRALVVCGLLFFATALSFLDRQVLSMLAPPITQEFGMSNSVYSRVVFAFVLSFSFTPVFLVSAVLYPAAWLVPAARRREPVLSRPEVTHEH